MITIASTDCNFEREPLQAPFGFKGKYVTELWQTVVGLRDTEGRRGLGLATQSVLWSDEGVFGVSSPAAGNALMFQVTAHALRLCTGRSFERPEQLLDQILPEAIAYARVITARPDLRPTFVLNALVAIDNAAWQLFAGARGEASFDAVAAPYGAALSHRIPEVAMVPLVSYGLSATAVEELAHMGAPLLKIKIGSDPEGDGDRGKMLAWDCERISQIHLVFRDFVTPHTDAGKVGYYLDANGRYDSIDRVKRLLDHCAAIGALDRVVLLEEPFAEQNLASVGDLPVRVVADESAHSVKDLLARIDAGYRAAALKPVAKTLSLSLRMAQVAHARGIACFCADLTANPILVDWGKVVASRLQPLPGMRTGILETNGSQNYRDWPRLESYHPRENAPWRRVENGLFSLDDEFFACSGGIFEASAHYTAAVSKI